MSDLKQIKEGIYNMEHFFDLSSDLLCISGYDGYFKRINPAVSKLLGYSNQELYARPISDFIHPEDRNITARQRFELTQSKPLYNFENRYVTKLGEIVWLSWTSHPVDNDELIFAIAKNITHKKKQEAERNELISNLTQINKELKQLTYTASHDLRSPVNNLLSVFSLLDVSKITDNETLAFIEILKAASQNLSQTLNTYVDTLSHKDENATLEVLQFQEVLQDVLHSINSIITSSNVTININFSQLEKITFNKAYLESIFLNLITNSIKYTQPGIAPVISIYSQKNNGKSQLIITDNGMGFDMEMVKDKIFGLHQKFHNHVDSKGIGLYLVYNHVTNLGGKITVESKVNNGTTFTIFFT